MSLTLLTALTAFTTFGSFQAPDLRGLWLKESTHGELRFYYFHSGGIGLYRYGRRRLNNTHSYDYRIDDGALVLQFRKTGETDRVAFRLERDGGQRWLCLDNDPREPGPTRYRKLEGPLPGALAGDHPFARMWTETRTFATGGMAFRIYQFQPPDAGGRGHGWYHQGDFDEWSTEAFSYVRKEGVIQLSFLERHEDQTTEIREIGGEKRAIELMSDPRNFWHRSRFVDGGRSIMTVGGTAFFERSHAP